MKCLLEATHTIAIWLACIWDYVIVCVQINWIGDLAQGVGLGGLCSMFLFYPLCYSNMQKFYRLCLKLYPKFAYYAQTMPIISGRSKLWHHNYITNLKPGLGLLGADYICITCCSNGYHVRTLSLGLGPWAWGWDTSQSKTGTGTWLGTKHSLRTRLPVYLRHYVQKVPIIFPYNAQYFSCTMIRNTMPA